jgi:hypothetical protein
VSVASQRHVANTVRRFRVRDMDHSIFEIDLLLLHREEFLLAFASMLAA